ncbi:MAG: hypothetical protein ACI4J7_04695 [Ruminiclostridium sp.]
MTLFHNADIKDINSIAENGLLPLSVTGNNRWNNERRAKNSKDVVYLFNPLKEQNSFVSYGIALIEVDVEAAEKTEMTSADKYNGCYDEYVISKVTPQKIKHIYIPEILGARITELSPAAEDKIIWVKMEADIFVEYIPNPDDPYGFGGTSVYAPADAETLEKFAETAPITVDSFNYFRATINNELVNLYNIKYII